MDNAKQHWPILRGLGTDLENKVREFMVIGMYGEGLIVATEDGLAYWIGTMEFGYLSGTKTATKPTPLNVLKLISMAQGGNYILLLNKRGQIYSMGKNDEGQLGLGSVDKETYFSPKLISSPYKFTSIRCGYGHSLALTKDGKVWAWGMNNCKQVGVHRFAVSSVPSPRQISELDSHRVVAIECGGWQSLALTDQGEVYGWGKNGNGSSTHISTRISTPSPVQSMAAGSHHTFLLTRTGEVYACGRNGYGQLGLSTTTKSSSHLIKVEGLPPISQIASHPLTNLSIAMSPDHRCYVWGLLADGTSISTPRELGSNYSTVESPLSFYSIHRNTPHSVFIPARECPRRTNSNTLTELCLGETNSNTQTESCLGRSDSTTQTELCPDSVPNHTPPNPILYQMFNNPDSSPDVRFQVEDQTIFAHRFVLQNFSGHFRQFFSSPTANLNPVCSVTSKSVPIQPRHTTNLSELESGPSSAQHTTNLSELESGPSFSQHTTNTSETDTTPHSSQVTISIPDHSYPAFHAYLRFIYLGIIEMSPEHLADLFSLSVAYLESDLQLLCILRMRTTLTPATCCLYYPLTHRHSFPELSTFQQDLIQFISTRTTEVYRTAAYNSMDGELCKKLSISIANLTSN